MGEPLTLEQALNLGYECMKLYKRPDVFLWIGDNGWKTGFEIRAAAHEHPNIAVSAREWPELFMAPPGGSWN